MVANFPPVTAVALRCESLVNPLGIDMVQPRLSWQMGGGRPNVVQSAYQVVVRNAWCVVWDSGKVSSDASVHVLYEGAVLQSRRRYDWRVCVWDERDVATEWSESAWWEMGLLDTSDWQASWIVPSQQPTQPEPPIHMFENLGRLSPDPESDNARRRPCQYVRRRFSAESTITQARIYATAHGVYCLYLNGKRVGNLELAPEVTAYNRRLQYQAYDVTDLLYAGDNVIGAIIGDGWWSGRIGLPGASCQYGDKLALLLQLEITYADGRVETLVSDEQFKSSTGALVYSDLFIGEKYNARLEPIGWHTANFDDTNWQPVELAAHGYANLIAQYGEPLRVVQKIAPIAILHTPNGDTLLDFGQNLHGKVRMRVEAKAGTEITLDHAEMLDADGNILHEIMSRNKDQRDVYVCSGDGVEEYEPFFTTHGFRYVRVSGYEPQRDDFTALVIASDLDQTGHFECSDARLNQLWRNIEWSQRSNFVSIPTDCPQRERAGFTGDAQVFAATACTIMGVKPFLTRWLRDVQVEQREDGQVPVIVPYWKSYHAIAEQIQGGAHTSAGWGDACIIVPWTLYQAYRDASVLAENYEMMVRWMAYIEREAAREGNPYLWNTGFHFGDWLMPSLTAQYHNPFKAAEATKEIVASCMYAISVRLMAQIAGVLGNAADRARFATLHEQIRGAFSAEYLPLNGKLSAHYQGMYVLALYADVVPADMRPVLAHHLADLIAANEDRLDTGFVSMPYLLDVLCDNGYADVAYRVLFQTECPSWLYQVERGATTIWESWDAISADGTVNLSSFNHYAFGCVGDWLVRHIAGLDKAQPGYKEISIKPHIPPQLTGASATFQSVYGAVKSAWRLDGDTLHIEATIPPNTTAKIYLPDGSDPLNVGSGTHRLDMPFLAKMAYLAQHS